jgi:hypothetical protein
MSLATAILPNSSAAYREQQQATIFVPPDTGSEEIYA